MALGLQITELKIGLDFSIFVPKMAIIGLITETVICKCSFHPWVYKEVFKLSVKLIIDLNVNRFEL